MAEIPKAPRIDGVAPGAKGAWVALFKAGLVGAYTGMSLQGLIAWAGMAEFDRSEIWMIPVIIVICGTVAVPFVCLGLVIFGLPADRLLHRYRRRGWVGLVAVVSGAIAGKLFYLVVDRLLFFGLYEPLRSGVMDFGVLYGVPSGVAFWWFRRGAGDA